MKEFYACKEPDGTWTLRQERYRDRPHPHDVCAVARSLSELREMCEKHWPDVDWDAAEG